MNVEMQTLRISDFIIQDFVDGCRTSVMCSGRREIRTGLLLLLGEGIPEEPLVHGQRLVNVVGLKHSQVKFLSVREIQEEGYESLENMIEVMQIHNSEFGMDTVVTILKIADVVQKEV